MTKRTCRYKNLRSILLVAILISAFQIVSSQQTPNYHERLTIEDGLPSNYITCLLKDKFGYLWVGTENGLVKYDGNKFTIFNEYDSNGNFIGKFINTIFEDKKGLIWIGTKNGLFRYERKSMRILKVNLINPNSKAKDKIYAIKQWNDSILTVGGFSGLFLYNINSALSTFHPYPDNLGTNFVEIFHSPKNYSAIIRINYLNFEFSLKTNNYKKIAGYENYFLETVFNKNYILYNLLNNNCYRLDTTNNLYEFSVNNRISMARSNNNWLYFLSENRVLKYNSDFKLIDDIFFSPNILTEERFYITCLQEENNGVIWCGSSYGLIKIFPKNQFHCLNEEHGLVNGIRSLLIDSLNNLYCGSFGNKLYLIKKINQSILKKKITKGSLFTIQCPTHLPITHRILELQNNNLLFLGVSNILLYNRKIQKITSSFFSKKATYWSAVENDNDIWVGTSTDPALTKLHIQNGTIVVDTIYDKFADSETAYAFYEDKSNQVWIGGEGLYKMKKQVSKDKFIFEEQLQYFDTITKRNNQVWSNIIELDEKRLLFGTSENGLFIFEKKTKRYKQFTEENGLLSNGIKSLASDNNQRIWIGTDKGLNCLNLKENKIYKYTVKEGLFTNNFNFKACEKTNDGWLLFGTDKGMIYFHPDSIKNKQIKYPLVINELKIFDEIANIEIRNGDTIKLKHNQDFFTLEFSLLDFRDPQKIQYEYSLIGNDKAFRKTTGKNPTASYTNVPPGNYVFELRTFDPSHQTIVENLKIPLIIEPAFYQTLIFKILVITTVLFVILIIFYLLYRRQVLNGKLVKLELDLLRSQMNPHFIFNIMSAIQGIVMKNEKIKAVDYLAKFARLMRMNLDYTRTEHISLLKTIQFLETYVKLESLNLNEEIDFTTIIDKNLNQNICMVSPLLIQPFIENAIIHGLAPKNKNMKLNLSIIKEDEIVLCKIMDNGVGREYAMQEEKKTKEDHCSVGIEITKKSNLLQQKKFKVKNEHIDIVDNFDVRGKASGTTVIIKIPYIEQN